MRPSQQPHGRVELEGGDDEAAGGRLEARATLASPNLGEDEETVHLRDRAGHRARGDGWSLFGPDPRQARRQLAAKLVGSTLPDEGNRDEWLGGQRWIDHHRSGMVPELE